MGSSDRTLKNSGGNPRGIPRLAVLGTFSVCLAGASTPGWAQAEVQSVAEALAAATLAAAPRPVNRLEMEHVDPAIESPSGTTARLYRLDQTTQARPSQELRTRVWWGEGAGSMGAGTDWAATRAGSSLRPLRPVVGVRANVSDQTRVVYEVRGPASALATTNALGATDPEARLALEFKSAKNPAQNLRNGLFRVQLSNGSALFLKPRGGGMVVSYRSQF